MGNEYNSFKEIENKIVSNFRNSDSKIKNTLEINSRNVSKNNFKIKRTKYPNLNYLNPQQRENTKESQKLRYNSIMNGISEKYKKILSNSVN